MRPGQEKIRRRIPAIEVECFFVNPQGFLEIPGEVVDLGQAAMGHGGKRVEFYGSLRQRNGFLELPCLTEQPGIVDIGLLIARVQLQGFLESTNLDRYI